jgi:flagellin
VDLNNTSNTFLTAGNQIFTFAIYDTNAAATTTAAVTVTGSSISGAQVLSQLNTGLSSYGLSAVTDSSGYLAFGGTRAFSVSVGTATAGVRGVSSTYADNAGVYRMASAVLTAITTAPNSETLSFQNASGSALVTLTEVTGLTQAAAVAAINAQTASLGIYAVASYVSASNLAIESSSTFSLTSLSAAAAAMGLVSATGAQISAVTAPDSTATTTGNALAAIASITSAVSTLGVVAGKVGTGQNKMQYAILLAQSQVNNFSAAESRIRDADIAAEAANLTKAQVMQQASLAAMAQANSAPQAVLALLRG